MQFYWRRRTFAARKTITKTCSTRLRRHVVDILVRVDEFDSAQDIRNQRIYRRQRKQELAKLNSTLADLNKKKTFYSEQIEDYDKYVDSCMTQLTKKPIK